MRGIDLSIPRRSRIFRWITREERRRKERRFIDLLVANPRLRYTLLGSALIIAACIWVRM